MGNSVRPNNPQKAVNYFNENDLVVLSKEELYKFYSNQLEN